MLSEEVLERLSERLVNRIEELNLYMIEKLGEQIVDIGTLTPSQLREVFQSIKYGNSLDDIAYQLADISNKNVKDIYEIFEEVAKQSQEYARQFYEYKNTDFIPFDENKILQQQVRTIAKATADEYLNMSKTFAYTFYSESGIKEFSSLSEIYQKVTDRAVLSLSQGRESFDTVMKRTMRELASQGLRTVDYASGYSRRADSSVRMNLMDGTQRLNRELQIQFGKEFGSDGIEISHHKNAAPDHIDTIDGQQFSTKGEVTINGITYKDYDTVNNSLDRHVGELNCHHHIYSIVLGVSKPLYSKEELEADKRSNEEGFEFEGKHYTMYEGTQLQRQIETKIRQYKDRQIGAKAIDDTDEVYHCEEKIRQLTQRYKELSDISGLPTKVERLRVEGYKKVALKDTPKREYRDVTKEWLDKATPNSHKVQDMNYFEHDGKRYEIDNKNIVLDYSKKEKEVAEWLEATFGGELYMVPRINKPNNISTPDFLWKGEKWDLKEIVGQSDRAIDNALKRKKEQASNFILDITKNNLNEQIFIKQIERIYRTSGREWIDKIILKKDVKVIAIYKRK